MDLQTQHKYTFIVWFIENKIMEVALNQIEQEQEEENVSGSKNLGEGAMRENIRKAL